MLTLEKDREFIVYPSWANLSYPWESLPDILSNPKNHRELLAGAHRDYSRESPKIEYISGPAGGGVIVVHQPHTRRPPDIDDPASSSAVVQWWGTLVIISGANLRLPGGRALEPTDPFGSLVTYLEPYENPPEAMFGLQPRRKLYVCGATPEHAQSAGKSVYWLASFEKRKRRDASISRFPQWAAHFGFSAREIATVPPTLQAETANWFCDPPEFDDVWFEVSTASSSAGFHFAILVHVALHARSIIKTLRAMHLVADIDGKPLFRKMWHRR